MMEQFCNFQKYYVILKSTWQNLRLTKRFTLHITGIKPLCWYYLIQNSPAVKKGAAPKNAVVKKVVKSKVAAKKWL